MALIDELQPVEKEDLTLDLPALSTAVNCHSLMLVSIQHRLEIMGEWARELNLGEAPAHDMSSLQGSLAHEIRADLQTLLEERLDEITRLVDQRLELERPPARPQSDKVSVVSPSAGHRPLRAAGRGRKEDCGVGSVRSKRCFSPLPGSPQSSSRAGVSSPDARRHRVVATSPSARRQPCGQANPRTSASPRGGVMPLSYAGSSPIRATQTYSTFKPRAELQLQVHSPADAPAQQHSQAPAHSPAHSPAQSRAHSPAHSPWNPKSHSPSNPKCHSPSPPKSHSPPKAHWLPQAHSQAPAHVQAQVDANFQPHAKILAEAEALAMAVPGLGPGWPPAQTATSAARASSGPQDAPQVAGGLRKAFWKGGARNSAAENKGSEFEPKPSGPAPQSEEFDYLFPVEAYPSVQLDSPMLLCPVDESISSPAAPGLPCVSPKRPRSTGLQGFPPAFLRLHARSSK